MARESKKRRRSLFEGFDEFDEMMKKFGGSGTSRSISIQQGPSGTRIDASGDVNVDELKEKYGEDAEIYIDGKRVDKPLIEVIDEDGEDKD